MPAQWVLPLAPGIAPETAAAALIQSMTAHYLSQAAYPVQPGGTVPVPAGAGGVGQPLTQVATLRGGRVICTVSTAQKEKLARDNDAADVIRYTETDFTAEVARLTAEAGVAAIYQPGPRRPHPQELQASAADVFSLIQSGQVRIHIGGRYPLTDARSAHEEMESRRSSS